MTRYLKAIHRKSKALLSLGKTDEAVTFLEGVKNLGTADEDQVVCLQLQVAETHIDVARAAVL